VILDFSFCDYFLFLIFIWCVFGFFYFLLEFWLGCSV
jgi:hypothetical protein